jgi:hypothetical protein
MTRRKGILGTTEIKRNILLTFWDKKKRGFLLRLRDGGSTILKILSITYINQLRKLNNCITLLLLNYSTENC